MTAPLTCKFYKRASQPACGEPGRVVTVACIHEHVYKTVLCPTHEDSPKRRCLDCWKLPKVHRHPCELFVERAA